MRNWKDIGFFLALTAFGIAGLFGLASWRVAQTWVTAGFLLLVLVFFILANVRLAAYLLRILPPQESDRAFSFLRLLVVVVLLIVGWLIVLVSPFGAMSLAVLLFITLKVWELAHLLRKKPPGKERLGPKV